MEKLGTDAFGRPLREPTKEDIESLLNYKPKPKPKEKLDLEGFTYIPKLKLYVADEISMLGKNWYECKDELNKKGSKMLTPREFWIYYDYCVKNREDLLEDSLKMSLTDEWLDAIIEDKKHLIINSQVRSEHQLGGMIFKGYDYIGGREYKNVFPKKGEWFNREDISRVTGLPIFNRKKTKKRKKEFICLDPEWHVIAIRKYCIVGKHYNHILGINLQDRLDYKNESTCVREVKEIK